MRATDILRHQEAHYHSEMRQYAQSLADWEKRGGGMWSRPAIPVPPAGVTEIAVPRIAVRHRDDIGYRGRRNRRDRNESIHVEHVGEPINKNWKEKPKPVLQAAEQEIVQRTKTALQEIRVHEEKVVSDLKVIPPASPESRLWVFQVIPNREGLMEAAFRSRNSSCPPVEDDLVSQATAIINKYAPHMPSVKARRVELSQR